MATLKELYEIRELFRKYEAPIPEKLAAEILEAEAPLLENINKIFAGIVPLELTYDELEGKVIVALEYNDGELNAIYSKCVEDACPCLETMTKLEIEPEPDEDEDEYIAEFGEFYSKTKGPSIKFFVKFGDGTIIKGKNGLDTFVKSLQHIGLEKASHWTGKKFKGFNLVDNKERTPYHITRKGTLIPWQKEVDGWFIYQQVSNETKMECLEAISEYLGIPLTIIR